MGYTSNDCIMSHSADFYREQAQYYRHAAYESFERCDTDGFLSQDSYRRIADSYDLMARIVENDGYWTFLCLYDLEGNPIEGAKHVETRYGFAWRIETKDDVKWFNPSKALKEETRVKNNAKKRYFEGFAQYPARIYCNSRIVIDPYSDKEVRYTVRFAE